MGHRIFQFIFCLCVCLLVNVPVSTNDITGVCDASSFRASDENDECTIGVAAGRATVDGRPLVWKTRDYASARDNEVYFKTSDKYKFVSVVTAGSSTAWMGVNEKGFAILNSSCSDLDGGTGGLGNGSLMTLALGTCATVSTFQHLLDSTNVAGRQTQGNFGVIDSSGAAAIFEIAGTAYWKYDANDTTVSPNGYVLRTNFAMHGDGPGGYSTERYNRTTKLIGDFHAGDSLNYRSIVRCQMRDFSDGESDPVSVPYPHTWTAGRPFGYIDCYLSICRSTSVSAAVIQGVLPGESAKLSTMWAILGQPASAIAVPYWPVGSPPAEANSYPTAPLCDAALQIKALLFDYPDNTNYIDSYKLLDGNGGGFWTVTFPAEDSVFARAERMLEKWRAEGPSVPEMLVAETEYAGFALSTLEDAYHGVITSIPGRDGGTLPQDFTLEQNYPNPFNASTTVRIVVSVNSALRLTVHDVLGRRVTILADGSFGPGEYRFLWHANDEYGTALPSGIYVFRLEAGSFLRSRETLLLR